MKAQRIAESVTRRDFLKGAAGGTLGVALSFESALAQGTQGVTPFAAANPASRVVLVRDERAVDVDHRISAKVVAEMLDTAMKALTGENDLREAWRRYFRPEDTVGLKFTRCEYHRIPTEQAVVDAVTARLGGVGVPKDKLHAADYGLLLKECTALINVPSVKVHALTGIAVSIKNYINFSGQPSSYHHEGSVKLPEVWLLPDVKGKTRLIVVDMLRPYFGPGPQVNPLHRWDYKGILVATDPVAVDTVCLSICQKKRNLYKGEEWLISPPPRSVAAADTQYHLGTSDPMKIKLSRLGWDKDLLV